MRRAEVAFTIFVAAVLGAASFLDPFVTSPTVETSERDRRAQLSTGWYCPAPAGGGFERVMGTTNLGSSPVPLLRWAVGEAKASAVTSTALPGRRRASISVGHFGIGAASAVAEAFGEPTIADLSVTSGPSIASSHCSVQPWNKWFFPMASTERGQDTVLLVSNPFEEEAVMSLRQLLPDREIEPALLKRVVIPKLTQVTVDLKESITATPSFGIEVTANIGRLVVSRFTRRDDRAGGRGISLRVGERSTSARWVMAGGEVPASGEEEIVVINPSDKEALVSVVFQTDQSQVSPPLLQEVAVPAGRQFTVKVSDLLPRGTRHSTVVTSNNEVGIVVERITVGLGSPSGFELVAASPAVGERWATPVGNIPGDETLFIFNASPGRAVARVSLITEKGESRPPELGSIVLEPGRRASIDMRPFLQGASTAVIETIFGTVVVERHVAGASDFASSPGIRF